MSPAGPATDIAIPLLASLDIGESVAFYRVLGFDVTGIFPDYAILRRGGMEIHLTACDDRYVAENTSCYLRVADVDTTHAEMAPRVTAPGRIDVVADMPWGMREFHIQDPHGNLLKVGQVIDPASGS